MAADRNELAHLIDTQIAQNGPMSIAAYMALCLTHPGRGYYQTRDPLGATGDFITAPEISQMFGELIGAFVADLYVQMGSPSHFALVEAGPGRGTLMRDLLRVASRHPALADALDLILLESSPVLRQRQTANLAAHRPRYIDGLDDLPAMPTILIANEFLDALPIHQYVRRDGHWFPRAVGLKDGQRRFALAPTPIPEAVIPPAIATEAQDGEVFEHSEAAHLFLGDLATHIAKRGGGALIVDYGYTSTQTGETLQAVYDHTYADPLAAPGEADLSAHVDFAALGETAKRAGLTVHGPVEQSAFLAALGIEPRAETLRTANPERVGDIDQALHRLTAPDQMGSLFKAMAATSPGLTPAGFGP